MPAGRAQVEAQVRSEIGAAVAGYVDAAAGTVADSLFNRTPPNGTIVAGTDGIAVRADGAWEVISYDAE